MKKLGLLLMPLMAMSLLASCNNGGGDKPEEVKFSLSSDKPITVEDKSATVNVDWTPTEHSIKFDSFTFESKQSKVEKVTFDQESEARPMPVTITFKEDITTDITGTLSFAYEDVTAKTTGESELTFTIPAPEPKVDYTTIDVSIPEEAGHNTFAFECTLKEGSTLEVDWGDKTTINEETSHTYSEPGDYKITINNITSLSLYGMDGHEHATNICLGNSVTSIGWGSFKGCIRLESINIPNSVTSIGGHAFEFCSSLTSIVIPSGVVLIADSTFNGCSSLASAILPSGLTSIGQQAFYGCSSLTSISIPDSITSIGGHAFEDCDSLHYNEYDNALYLGNETNKCVMLMKAKDSITSCNINENCKIIYSMAFSHSMLVSIDIPYGVVSIGGGAFFCSSDLSSISIPSSVTSIGSNAFEGCISLQYNEYGNALYLGNKTNEFVALIETKDKDIESCEINSNCKLIADIAFYECYSLTSINISNSVTSIGDNAFTSCSRLGEINLEQFGMEDEIPTCGNNAFFDCSATFEVASVDMANKFKDSDKGWPESLDAYHWPDKPSSLN